MRATVSDGTVDIDTGLQQPNQSFPDYSPNEPGLAQRIQVIPLSPIAAWSGVTHGEPYLDPATGTIHVQFSAGSNGTINVLFWDMHAILGPGDADTYNPPPPPV
jgi:hypothetical protein